MCVSGMIVRQELQQTKPDEQRIERWLREVSACHPSLRLRFNGDDVLDTSRDGTHRP